MKGGPEWKGWNFNTRKVMLGPLCSFGGCFFNFSNSKTFSNFYFGGFFHNFSNSKKNNGGFFHFSNSKLNLKVSKTKFKIMA